MANYQMFWDCSSCGTKKLLGVSHRHCPNCGAAQDEEKRYFPPEGQEVELHNHTYYGVDWDCQHCSTPNAINSNNCVNCGASKDGSYNVALVGRSSPKIKNVADNEFIKYRSISFTDLGKLGAQKVSNIKEGVKTSFNGKNKKWFILAGVILTLVMGLLIYGYFRVTDHTVTVNEKTWTRSISIEKFDSVSDSDWCSGMPIDAYSVSRTQEVRSHKQVADGESCHTVRSDNGDGSYSSDNVCTTNYRSEPVYDNRCRYKIDRWRFSQNIVARGGEKDEIYFPDVSKYIKGTGNSLGNTRAGKKSENYNIGFTYQDKKVVNENCSYNQAKWKKFVLNNQYAGRVRMISGLICNEVSEVPMSADNNKASWDDNYKK